MDEWRDTWIGGYIYGWLVMQVVDWTEGQQVDGWVVDSDGQWDGQMIAVDVLDVCAAWMVGCMNEQMDGLLHAQMVG